MKPTVGYDSGVAVGLPLVTGTEEAMLDGRGLTTSNNESETATTSLDFK